MNHKQDKPPELPSQSYYHPYHHENHRVRLPLTAKILGAFIFLLVLTGYAPLVVAFLINFVDDFKWYLLAFGIIYFFLSKRGII